jgi:Flp pilus assembly protein TadG
MLRRCLKGASADGGNVIMIFALGMPLAVGAGALGVETSFEYVSQTRLQTAADAAAYAGALDNRAGKSNDIVVQSATAMAMQDGWSSAAGTITVNTPPASGPNQNAAATEVLLSQTVPRFFTAYFNKNPLVIHARAVAIYRTAADACILALDQTASQAVNVQGNTTVSLVGCDVMSNSIASDAVNVWGSAKITSDCVVSAGGVTNKGGMTVTGCPSAITQAPRAHDPFSGLATPAHGTNRSVPNKGPFNLLPGYYNSGMDLRGTVTLAPGTYYVSGGDFRVNANADVSGSGVTIFLESGSSVSMMGNAHVNLSAPTSGTYSGILFFGDRNATSGSVTFNGDASSSLTGDLYFPTQTVSYQGNFSGTNGCMQIVADTVQWTGNAASTVRPRA